ncbi:rod shape-determining protein RodA [bacterium]|nr:rod shape-determining protein RodA [candidate division CSSED10-310 bacterium]
MIRRYLEHFDFVLLSLVLIIGFLGILTIYSVTSDDPPPADYQKQIAWTILGILCLFGSLAIDYRLLKKVAPVLYLVVIAFLVFLLLHGRTELGVRRWILIPFIQFRLQPSEFAKPAIVLMLARWMERWRGNPPSLRQLLMPAGIMIIPLIMILKQPDLGTSLILPPVFLAMVFVSGFRVRTMIIIVLCLTLPLAFVAPHVIKPYQMKRITSFLDPEADPLGSGYQLIQSKIAFGSGGLTGKGFKQGPQSHLDFLPVQDTDFIFAVWGEERGFIGAVLLLSLFIFLTFRCLTIARKANDLFGTYVCVGLTSILFCQIFINTGMVIGLMPITGLPLPLMSYGGSACLTNFVSLAFILNIGMRSFSVYQS